MAELSPEQAEPCDADSALALLPNTIANLNLQQVRPQHAKRETDLRLSPGNDSGYSSTSGTPEILTPEQPDFHEREEKVLPEESRRRLFPRTVKTLKVFNTQAPPLTRNRFDDLNELFGKRLVEHLIKESVEDLAIRCLSIKLKFVGEDQHKARPCVLILCDKSVAKSIRAFFSSKDVRSQYQPSKPTVDTPYFEIKVYERQPRLIALFEKVYGGSSADLSQIDRFHGVWGKLFKIQGDDRSTGDTDRYGTLGGLLMAETIWGTKRLYGLSAGHMFSPRNHSPQKLSKLPSSKLSESPGKTDDDFFLESDSFDLDLELDSSTDHKQNMANSTRQPQQHSQRSKTVWSKIGQVAKTSTSTDLKGGEPNHDWALIEILKPDSIPEFDEYTASGFRTPPTSEQWTNKRSKSSRLETVPESSVKGSQSTNFTTERPVEVFCGVSGHKFGFLSATTSPIVIPPGESFVRTYSLRLSDGTALVDGDCGSWVVDSKSARVCGHVVATDDFGEAYVIPIGDTFRDIMIKLPASSIHVPRPDDIANWYSTRCSPQKAKPTYYRHRSPQSADSGYSSMFSTPISSAPVSPRDAIGFSK